ncbi:MAG: hypothetical protein ACKJSK_17745 [Roseibacillus sp.]
MTMDTGKKLGMKMTMVIVVVLSHSVSSPPLLAQGASKTAILPPTQPWHGKSESLVVSADNEWITRGETS